MAGQQFIFGVGNLYGLAVGGGAPRKFGTLQDVSIEFSADIKELYGQYSFPVAVARGKAKIECKAMMGNIDPLIYNNLFFSQTETVNYNIPVTGEAHTVASSSATATNGASFVEDHGVYYAATGVEFTQVTTPTAAGQYSVNSTTGVYTFYTSDNGASILIDYSYSQTTGGATIAIGNPLMASAPTWRFVATQTFQGKSAIFTLNSCTSSKLSLPFKQDDFAITELDFSAQADASGNLGSISLST